MKKIAIIFLISATFVAPSFADLADMASFQDDQCEQNEMMSIMTFHNTLVPSDYKEVCAEFADRVYRRGERVDAIGILQTNICFDLKPDLLFKETAAIKKACTETLELLYNH